MLGKDLVVNDAVLMKLTTCSKVRTVQFVPKEGSVEKETPFAGRPFGSNGKGLRGRFGAILGRDH